LRVILIFLVGRNINYYYDVCFGIFNNVIKSTLVFQFSYENPVYKGKENPNCCKLLPNLCWRHCLKTVKIEDSRGFADEEDLGKYFHENAKILKSFQGFAN
jgi:hypothetical protein